MLGILALLALGQDAKPPSAAAPQDEAKASLDMYGAHLRTKDWQFDLAARYIMIGLWDQVQDSAESGPNPTNVFRNNGFYTAQARIELGGQYRGTWEFLVSGELIGDHPTLADGYLGYIGTSWLRLRLGQQKVPLGLELFDSFLYTEMAQYSFANAILPGRELGFTAWGFLPIVNEAIEYQMMVGKGAVNNGQNQSIGLAGPDNDELNFNFQIIVFPGRYIESEWTKHSRAAYFHEVGLANNTPILDIRLSDTGTKIIQWNSPANGGTVVMQGQRERDGVWFTWGWRNFGLEGQWYRVDFETENSALGGPNPRANLHIIDWFIDLVWVVTGEEKIFGTRISPSDPLDKGGWGAWEIAYRFERWESGDHPHNDQFALFLVNPAAYTRVVINHTFAVNWWPHPNVRAGIDLIYHIFQAPLLTPAGASIDHELGFLVRVQFGAEAAPSPTY